MNCLNLRPITLVQQRPITLDQQTWFSLRSCFEHPPTQMNVLQRFLQQQVAAESERSWSDTCKVLKSAKQMLPSPKLQHRNHLFLCHVRLQQNSTLPSISQTFVGFHDAFDFQAGVCFELQKLAHSTAAVHVSEVRHTQCTESLGTDEKMHLRLCLCFDSSNTPVGQPSFLGSLLAQLQ